MTPKEVNKYKLKFRDGLNFWNCLLLYIKAYTQVITLVTEGKTSSSTGYRMMAGLMKAAVEETALAGLVALEKHK